MPGSPSEPCASSAGDVSHWPVATRACTRSGAFCAANLIIYLSGFATIWKLAIAMVVGLVLFAIGAVTQGTASKINKTCLAWVVPWLGGHVLISALGRYGEGYEVLPDWVDLGVVLAFALVVYYVAVRMTLTAEESAAAIAKDASQLDYTEAPAA